MDHHHLNKEVVTQSCPRILTKPGMPMVVEVRMVNPMPTTINTIQLKEVDDPIISHQGMNPFSMDLEISVG